MNRQLAPTTGDANVDASFAILATIVAQDHRLEAFRRGWFAYMSGRPLPVQASEAEGYMAAVHACTWEDPAELTACA